MIKSFDYCITGLLLWIFVFLIGRILFDEEKRKLNIPIIIEIIVFGLFTAFFNSIDSEILRGTIKILVFYSLFCLFYKSIFKKNWSTTLLGSIIFYLSLALSEVLIALLVTGIFSIFNKSLLFLKNSIIINFVIMILELLITIKFKNSLKLFIKKCSNNRKRNYILIIPILITISLLIFRIPLKEWQINAEFIITMIILLCFCIVGLYVFKQQYDIEKTSSMYQQFAEYSNVTNKVLEEYRMVNHEHKNQLSIIRQMIGKDDKKIKEYIDNLINVKNNIKYKWVADLNSLPLSGLKGLINYKLLEMEENNINITVSISKEISKVKLEKLSTKQKDSLYSIVGVYLDNAIEASRESKKKEIDLQIYKDKNSFIIQLSNTYKGKIDIDRLDEYGYTTKGKNHGVGLHIVKNIIEVEKIFSQTRKILDEYYIQELRIDLEELKNNKKNKTTK